MASHEAHFPSIIKQRTNRSPVPPPTEGERPNNRDRFFRHEPPPPPPAGVPAVPSPRPKTLV